MIKYQDETLLHLLSCHVYNVYEYIYICHVMYFYLQCRQLHTPHKSPKKAFYFNHAELSVVNCHQILALDDDKPYTKDAGFTYFILTD